MIRLRRTPAPPPIFQHSTLTEGSIPPSREHPNAVGRTVTEILPFCVDDVENSGLFCCADLNPSSFKKPPVAREMILA